MTETEEKLRGMGVTMDQRRRLMMASKLGLGPLGQLGVRSEDRSRSPSRQPSPPTVSGQASALVALAPGGHMVPAQSAEAAKRRLTEQVRKTSLKKSRKAEPTKASKLRPEDVPVPDDSDLEDAPPKKGVNPVKDNGLSRGQRKRLQRRENFLRKFELAKVVQAQDKAKSGLDLSALTDGLEEALVSSTPSEREGSLKRPGRKAQAANDQREMTQFQNVLNFQAFKSDPLGALEQHLKNSIKLQKEDEAKQKVKAKTPASVIKDKLKEKKRTGLNAKNVKSVKGKFSKPKRRK